MIKPQTIDRIMQAADILEVIGDFVTLKKRGANYVGLSPFANEKTPSFTVSPTKNIFKDFSSGKGGSVVTFLMEHEKYSYPEALRWLAQKYNIEIEEDLSPESIQENDDRESLYLLNEYARKQFADNLQTHPDGKLIGLSYFKERGFREDTIQKFSLGFCLDVWDGFSQKALKDGYLEQFLEQSGLSIKSEKGFFDRFRGRVMFPIHNLTGRVIGFGGRILKNDAKAAKYVNSPESIIYHKSHTLYGIFFAKNKIRDQNECMLVEGYTDVISLHQSGIENVVASSGTSLTIEQIRLIGRFTQNITILYDGDPAGIKASLRGIDMILEEGLNVKIVLFPEGHDPDSFVQKVGTTAFTEYIASNKKDFILFKTNLLLQEAQNDPLKRAEMIRDIVESIAKIPDSIKTSVFVAETSRLLGMEERVLLAELNKLKLKKVKAEAKTDIHPQAVGVEISLPEQEIAIASDDAFEIEIIRLLLQYGNLKFDEENTVASYLFTELADITFEHPEVKVMYARLQEQLAQNELINEHEFTMHSNQNISHLAVSLLTTPYTLSDNWFSMHQILVAKEPEDLSTAVLSAIFKLKLKKLMHLMKENQEKMKLAQTEQELDDLLKLHQHLNSIKIALSNGLGAVVLK